MDPQDLQDLQPLTRRRSCTWPLPRPDLQDLQDLQDVDPEFHDPDLVLQDRGLGEPGRRWSSGLMEGLGERAAGLHHPPPPPPLLRPSGPGGPGPGPCGSGSRRRGSSRRNAWGNLSYADLISKAIESSADHRLTLSQIYDWMEQAVPFFRGRGLSSSAGWKNSIRHNLSLHSCFVRIQNEGTGRSSWWTLNPDGGQSGRSPRRRAASMDDNNNNNNNNRKLVKSRGRAAKKKVALQQAVEGSSSPGYQYCTWLGSPAHSNEDFESWSSFRTRTSSDASTLSGRCSPFSSKKDDLVEPKGRVLLPGASGVALSSAHPSLAAAASLLGSEKVMENLLDNLHLLPPKSPQLDSTPSNAPKLQGPAYKPQMDSTPSNAAMLQGPAYKPQMDSTPSNAAMLQGPAYKPQMDSTPSNAAMLQGPAYKPQRDYIHSPNAAILQSPAYVPQLAARPPDYLTVVYGGARMRSPAIMQMLPNKAGFDVYENQLVNPAGLLKELLTTDGGMMASREPLASDMRKRAQLMPSCGAQMHVRGQNDGRVMDPSQSCPEPLLSHPAIFSYAPSAAARLHMPTCGMTPLISLKAPCHMTNLRTSVQPLRGHPTQGSGISASYGGYREANGGYRDSNSDHLCGAHLERLPSDLDNVSPERLECDLQSVLHDTLMDGNDLDFNFDPNAGNHTFTQRVNAPTHSWVSG